MFIQLAKRFHENKDGSISVYPNYRLMKAYRDTDGKPRKRAVLSLGALEGMTDADRDELADLLTVIIKTGQCVLCENRTRHHDEGRHEEARCRQQPPRQTRPEIRSHQEALGIPSG